MNSRLPLKDISESVRAPHRLNATVSKPTSNPKVTTCLKYGKVVSSRPTLRRRRTLFIECKNQHAGHTAVLKRCSIRPEVEDKVHPSPAVTSIDDSIELLVSVKDEDVWLCNPAFAHDVYLYTKNLEDRHRFAVDYLSESDSRVTNEMRATLINWLVEIHGHLKLEAQTLHVAVKLLDAVLHLYHIGVAKLQLCGLSVLWIASKLESRQVSAEELLYLMCHKGDVSMLIDMEQTVLNILDFQLQLADPIFFLNRLMLYDDNGSSQEFYNTCTYCMDSILHDITTVDIAASEMANSALLAARLIDGRMDWPKAIGYATGHWPSTKQLRPLAFKMIETIVQVNDGVSSYSGAYKKYASHRRFNNLSDSNQFSGSHLRNIMEALSNNDSQLSV